MIELPSSIISSGVYPRTSITRPLTKLSAAPFSTGSSVKMISSMFARIIDAKFRDESGTIPSLPAEDALQPPADGAEDALHRALHPLLHVALMDRAQA